MHTGVISVLRKAQVVHRGRFVLKSGAVSDFYIDMKSAWGNPAILRKVAIALAARLPRTVTAVASSGYGGLPLGTAVSLVARLPLVLVRDQPKGHGRKTVLNGYMPRPGDRIALLDDVYSSGTGMRIMENALEGTGAKVAARMVVVSRAPRLPRGTRALVRADALFSRRVE